MRSTDVDGFGNLTEEGLARYGRRRFALTAFFVVGFLAFATPLSIGSSIRGWALASAEKRINVRLAADAKARALIVRSRRSVFDSAVFNGLHSPGLHADARARMEAKFQAIGRMEQVVLDHEKQPLLLADRVEALTTILGPDGSVLRLNATKDGRIPSFTQLPDSTLSTLLGYSLQRAAKEQAASPEEIQRRDFRRVEAEAREESRIQKELDSSAH